jgi:hypothetical protein
MSYIHIDNLYANQDILLFRECYAMEKIHGTSARISWKDGQVMFFAGGADHGNFTKLFDESDLHKRFTDFFDRQHVVVYGEAYGGKCFGMKETYGPNLRFVAFEVKIEDYWLNVPNADDVVTVKFGLEFVHYNLISTNIDSINAERDADSVQAVRNGMGPGKMREGIVLRPLIELVKNNGKRIISKHKRDEFKETKSSRELDPARRQILEDAEGVAEEWVTPMRLTHVLQKLPGASIRDTPDIIKAMIEDVVREATGEILDSNFVRKAIGRKAAALFKQHLVQTLEDSGKASTEIV